MKERNEEEYSTKKAVYYSFAGFTDVVIFQFFSFLIFTFYYAVIGLSIFYLTLAFIIWSIWNAFNDPMLGAISDRTSTKWGRRKPFIVIAIFPLLIINILLWTPPEAGQEIIFLYFLVIIIVWEFFYTMWSLNQTSLFPELFRDIHQRTKANNIIQFFQIISLMIAFIFPSFFIPDYSDPQYRANYITAAIVISVICAISASIFIKFGLKERIEFSKDPQEAPGFIQSLKYTLGNKSFRFYMVGVFALWFVFGMVPTIIAIYGKFVLGVQDSFLLSMLLATAFISAAIFVFLWKIIINKVGIKKAFIGALIVLIITSFPFMIISEPVSAFIFFFIFGIGLAGAFIVRDVAIAVIIDEDELKNGVRREAGFYGINGFIVKLTNIVVIICIAIVFYGTEMLVFDPGNISEANVFGLRSLMFIFPAVFLVLGLIAMYFFPIDKENYDEITDRASELHQKKLEKLGS